MVPKHNCTTKIGLKKRLLLAIADTNLFILRKVRLLCFSLWKYLLQNVWKEVKFSKTRDFFCCKKDTKVNEVNFGILGCVLFFT